MSIEKIIDQAAARRRKKKIATLIVLMVLLAAIVIVLLLLFAKRPVSILPGPRNAAPVYDSSIFADFVWPIGVAVSRDGSRVYVVDSTLKKVKVFNTAGKQVGSFGKAAGQGGVEPGFANPLYAAVNSKGQVYVSDRSMATVAIYDKNGAFVSKFIPKAGEGFTWSPLGLAFDLNDNLYVTDATKGQHRVLVFALDGTLKMQFGKEGTGNGEFAFPNGVAVTKNGNIYVSDSNNARVQVFSPKGKYLFTIGKAKGKASLAHPLGIAIDEDGRLHVVDTFAHAVNVYNDKGTYLYSFGSFGVKDGQFQFPTGMAISGRTVYVADRENKRLQVWEY